MTTRRVALVTGSSSGIGEATARSLGAAGFAVVVNSSASVAAGQALAAQLPAASYVQADIADAADARCLVDQTIDRYGRLDVLVNNAGVTVEIPHSDLAAATPEVWRRVLNVNVVGTWQVAVAAAAVMSAGGHIVNVTSIAGTRPVGSSIPYAVSKAALNHMTRLLANVLGPGIQVNAVAPGLIETPWTTNFHETASIIRTRAPLRRVGRPAEVAATILGLIQSSYLTGEVVHVDGGAHLI